MDEVFAADACRAQVVWKRTNSHNSADTFGPVHDTVLVYTSGPQAVWNAPTMKISQAHLDSAYAKIDKDGRKYGLQELTAPGRRNGSSGDKWRGFDPNTLGRHWRWETSELDAMAARGRIHLPSSGGWPRLIVYREGANTEKPASDWWDDVTPLFMSSGEREDYPTQKPEALVERVVEASSASGDLVLDCFIGSGTTAAVAQRLGRRWIGCDINRGAIQTTEKRVQAVIGAQSAAAGGQKALPGMEGDAVAKPASLSFQVWRVNDYDLQIQHNEAVALACEHIGVERTKTDTYFDGVQGRRVVKIVPFNHPLSPFDLEDLRTELKARKDEERDILLVCLGMERSCAAWLEDWNRMRKKGDVPNKIEVIELRTDPKYGRFIAHRPASARVSFKRGNDTVTVEIKDFASPSILERLTSQAGLLKPHIEDWRSMVDSVMIDPAYDGKVLNIAMADVPEKKSDLVVGSYELPAPKGKTTVAVKITDMLGEDVLVIGEV